MAYLDGKSNKMMDELFLSYDHEHLNQHSFKLSENKSIASTSSELAVTFLIPRIEGDRGNDILTSKAEIELTQSHPLVKQFPFKTKPGFISKDPKARQLWLAEHSNIDEISSDIVKVSSNATPRAAKWDLAAMKKAMLKKNITFLK
ncbi:hypothetical protein C5167_029268, partial [Papaver somniferum]